MFLPAFTVLQERGRGVSTLWVSGKALLYRDYRTDWRGRGSGREERGVSFTRGVTVTPLTCCVD